MRFLLSLIILMLMITYLVIPLVKRIKKFGKKEIDRIDEEFNEATKNKTIRKEE